jgi:hypothetical protein
MFLNPHDKKMPKNCILYCNIKSVHTYEAVSNMFSGANVLLPYYIISVAMRYYKDPAPGKYFDDSAAPAPASSLLYTKQTFIKPTKVNIKDKVGHFFL